MSEWKLKRFWTETAAVQTDDGWTVTLDGRAVKTPAKALLTVPTQALAQAIADEWQAQEGEVDPGNMPMTRLANSAQDKVSVQFAAVADIIADYGGSDLLCYRADGPEALIARQAELWDPLLDWIKAREGIVLNLQTGIMPIPQPEASLRKIAELTLALSVPELTGFHDLVSLSGSWVIGIAALRQHQSPEALWDAAHVDEIWQVEQWGEDEDALDARMKKRDGFIDALEFAKLST